MLKRPSLVLVLLALGLFLAACGGDDDDTTETTQVSESQSVILPAAQVAAKDGAQAHSESQIYECSSMDLDGDIGTAAFGGFQDISVRGLSCETAKTRILDVYDTFDDGNVASTVDGYDCSVIERLAGGLNTIRCFTTDGRYSFRFTAVPSRKRHVELVSECGTFGRFYDVSVRGQGCEAGATFLDNTPTSQLTSIPEGEKAAVGSQTCTTLYVEGDDRTVRCTEDEAALRFSIATKPSTSHPSGYTEKPRESSTVGAKTKKDAKPATGQGLNPLVTISCTATDQFDAITAKGVNCATVTTLLTQNATEIEALERGAPKIQVGGVFACARIDTGDETPTVQCRASTSGASFRASPLPPSTPAPSDANPSATTTPAAEPSGETTVPDTTTPTTTEPATSTPSPAAAP